MSAPGNPKKTASNHKPDENEKSISQTVKELNDELDALEKEIKARIAKSASKSVS